MKKNLYVLLTIGLFIVSIKSNAQVAYTFTAGPKVGINLSTISNVKEPGWGTGLTAGGFFQYSLTNHFGFNVDLLYVERGTRYKITEDFTGTLQLTYFEMPILFNYYYGDRNDNLHPKINVGPVVGFLLEGTQTGKGYVTNDYNNFVYALRAGSGINFHTSAHSWINLDLSYTLGLSNLADVPTIPTVGGNMKSRGFEFVVSFGIDLNQ